MASTVNVRVTAEDRRLQILETATDLFGRQGYLGTTTRQIADHAGVNEAIIFRHFPSKEDLYWEVLDRKIRDEKSRARIIERLHAGGPQRDVFIAIGRDFLERRYKDPSMTRMLLFTALEDHKLSSRFFHTHIVDIYEALADYIRRQIEAGHFRDVDPLLAARGFLGMFVYHFMVEELFGARKYHDSDVQQVSETLTDIWLRGMLLSTDQSRPTATTKSTGSKRKTRIRAVESDASAPGNGIK